MNKSIARTATVSAAALLAASAFCQEGLLKPGYVKASIGYPLSSDVRDDVSKNTFGLALGYTLPKAPVVGTVLGTSSIELNYLRLQGNGASIDGYGAQFVYRQPLVKGITPGPFGYIGGGIGFQYTKVEASGVSTNKTTVAGQILLGMDFTQMFFVELGYHYVPDIDGVNAQSISLGAGVRF